MRLNKSISDTASNLIKMDSEFKYDAFLSYSSKDKEVVHALAERLKQDGLRVWLDAWAIRPGDSIPLKGHAGTVWGVAITPDGQTCCLRFNRRDSEDLGAGHGQVPCHP